MCTTVSAPHRGANPPVRKTFLPRPAAWLRPGRQPNADTIAAPLCPRSAERTASTGVSTRSLGDDVFASTIQASLAAGDGLATEMDDAEIERSIREINEAIKRTSQKRP